MKIGCWASCASVSLNGYGRHKAGEFYENLWKKFDLVQNMTRITALVRI